MQSGAKYTLISGGVVLLIGIVMALVGGSSAGGLDGDWVGEKNDWNGREGAYPHMSDSRSMYVFVPKDDAVRCEDFSLTITRSDTGGDDSDSEVKYVHDSCTGDGELPEGHGDDPSDYWHYGRIWGLEMGEDYLLEANSDVFLINGDWLDEKIGEVVGGYILGILGGGGCACCGVAILLVGLILALTMKDESPTTIQFDSEGRVMVNQGDAEGSESGTSASDATDAWYKQTE
jgi:hypothetical protein